MFYDLAHLAGGVLSVFPACNIFVQSCVEIRIDNKHVSPSDVSCFSKRLRFHPLPEITFGTQDDLRHSDAE